MLRGSQTLRDKGPLGVNVLSVSIPPPSPPTKRRKREVTEVTAETSIEFSDPAVDPTEVDAAVDTASDAEVAAAENAEREK